MHLHTHQAKRPVLPMVTLHIYLADTYNKSDKEPIISIVRQGRNAVLAVARAHYSGNNYVWVWAGA